MDIDFDVGVAASVVTDVQPVGVDGDVFDAGVAVYYTHLTLPTKRIV